MSNNWKPYVASMNAKTYVLPAGWDSRDTVAAQLECSTDRVRVVLAPAIKAGEVETKQFPVWDRITKRVVSTTAYRRRVVKITKPATKPAKK